MADGFSYRLELLQKELEMLQDGIRGYDSIVFTIKGWAITVFSGMVLFAVDKQKPFLYLFCATSILAFWFIDAFYKSTQNILIRRYQKVETFIQSPEFEQAVLSRNFGTFRVPFLQEGFRMKRRDRLRLLMQAALQGHTCLLYVFLLFLSLSLFRFQ